MEYKTLLISAYTTCPLNLPCVSPTSHESPFSSQVHVDRNQLQPKQKEIAPWLHSSTQAINIHQKKMSKSPKISPHPGLNWGPLDHGRCYSPLRFQLRHVEDIGDGANSHYESANNWSRLPSLAIWVVFRPQC